MNGFDAFWAALEAKGQAGEFHDPRILAMLAWDGALCAAQDRNRDAAGKMLSALKMAANLSGLHTWVKSHPTTPPLHHSNPPILRQ